MEHIILQQITASFHYFDFDYFYNYLNIYIQNVFDDFISAGEYLVGEKITKPAKWVVIFELCPIVHCEQQRAAH